jgi:hypothetical protein
MDEAGGIEQGAPAGVSVPSQRHVEALTDHAIDHGPQARPRVEPPKRGRNFRRRLLELEEAQGGNEGAAGTFRRNHGTE